MITISEGFGNLNITINHPQIAEVEKMVIGFLNRKTHPLTFNGPYLGIDPVAFTTGDRAALFEIFDLHESDVKETISHIYSIDKSFLVQSDPFNLLCMWLVHLAPIFIKNKQIQTDFVKNILRYYHYKIFTSVVNRAFSYGANRGVMEATVASLTLKSDIVRYQSWKALIDSHCDKIMDVHDRTWWQTLMDASPDDAYLRVVSETQTALRAKIVTFANVYYETHSKGDMIGFRSSVTENDDGEKILMHTASVIDSATQAMVHDVLNVNMFIHEPSIEDVAKLYSSISTRMLKTALLRINQQAVFQTQAKHNAFDEVKITKTGEATYVGIRALLLEIIRSTIRLCRDRKVNLGNKALVFQTMRDVYAASRTQDEDVQTIKRSVTTLTDNFQITSNDTTKSQLRLAIISYLIYRTIRKMTV